MEAKMIQEFRGEYRWLSNFWFARFVLDGVSYPTVEHAYQAAKAINPLERAMILACDSPGSAKRYGSKVKLVPGWETIKEPVMRLFVGQKFKQNPELADKLYATGGTLIIEGNRWHDTFWGKCNCNSHGGVGENRMGKILMDLREELGRMR